MSNYKKPLYLILLIAALCAGFFLGKFYTKGSSALERNTQDSNPLTDRSIETRQSGFKYINPILECSDSEADFTELKPFKQELQTLVDSEKASGNANFVSIYYRDMNNGPWLGINESETFSPASLLKVPLMIAYYKLSQTKPGILGEQIKVTTLAQIVPNIQEIKPEQRLEIGKTYTVGELIEHMIRYSDNDAAQLLITHVDLQTLADVYKDFSVSLPTEAQPETPVTVRQYASFFRILFNGSYLTKEDSEKAMETMVDIDYKNGLVAGVPGNISVAHKFGERLEDNQQVQLHDCGIIYYPKRPYLLCVMTRGKDETKLSSVIKDISALVYKQVDSQLTSMNSQNKN